MKWLKRLGVAIAVLAVALVLWLFVGNDVANRRLIAVEKAWSEAPGSLDDFPKRHPAVATNEAARRLESAAEALDVDLRPRFRSKSEDSKRSRSAAETAKAVSAYLDASFADPDGAASPPSGEAEAVLAKMAPGLVPIAELLSKEKPVWLEEIGRGYEAPIPNLLGQLRLQRILLASALRLSSRGDPRGAEALLDASWTLNGSLVTRPELISQLIAIAVGRMEAGVLRKVPVEPGRWIPRLSARDARKGLVEAFTAEAWVFRDAVLRGALLDPDGTARSRRPRLLEFLSEPYLKVQAASLLGTLREFVRESKAAPITGFTSESRDETAESPGGFSDVMSRLMLPNMENARLRADRAAVDLDLTRKVLELRAARGTAKEWPATVPGMETSVVKDARWVYTRTPDGRATIELSRRLDWGNTFGLVLPSRWVSPN